MKHIQLTNSANVAIVDDADFEHLSKFRWREHVCRNTSYAIRSWRENGRTLSTYMHRQLLDAPKGTDVDHKDYNGLNNQRHNIQLKTRASNLHRSRPISGSKSGLKGVWWSEPKQRWNAQITISERRYSLGSYTDKFLAAFAYNIAARILHDSDTFQNNIPSIIDPETSSKIHARVISSLAGTRRKNQYA